MTKSVNCGHGHVICMGDMVNITSKLTAAGVMTPWICDMTHVLYASWRCKLPAGKSHQYQLDTGVDVT